jgi:hypothetical protein
MLRKITIYIGSFKPPHKGHLFLVKKMLKMTKAEKKGDYPGIVYIFISNKEREPCGKITGVVSKEIWKEYIKTLPVKDQARVKLILSSLPSPTQTAYGFVNKLAKKGDIFYLIKSAKNADNTRFASLLNMKKKGIDMYEMVLPGYENLNASDMRNALYNDDKKEFSKYIPKMSIINKNKIWNKLKVLC